MKTIAHIERNPTDTSAGTHFPKLAFKKLARLGGVARRSAFTPQELVRLAKWFPNWVRKLGRAQIEITAQAWIDLNAADVDPNTLLARG